LHHRELCARVVSPVHYFCPTAFDSSVSSHFSRAAAVMLTVSRNSLHVAASSAMVLLCPLQRVGFVHGVASGLIAAYPILRLILRGAHRPSGCLCVACDLLFDGTCDGGSVAAPLDLVALAKLRTHSAGDTRAITGKTQLGRQAWQGFDTEFAAQHRTCCIKARHTVHARAGRSRR
jgi:hypothetical protein